MEKLFRDYFESVKRLGPNAECQGWKAYVEIVLEARPVVYFAHGTTGVNRKDKEASSRSHGPSRGIHRLAIAKTSS